MIKTPLRLVVVAAVLLLVSACGSTPAPAGSGGAPSGAPLQKVGDGEGAVAIVAWPGYIERGETDKSYDWVTGFEKDSGCKVSVKTAATSDEMVALMNEGGFDLVTASGDASLRLVAGNRVQEVNTALIPSWGKIDPRLQSAPWHTVGDKHYGVPYQWGPNVLAYNTEVFKGQAPDSWKVVFEATCDQMVGTDTVPSAGPAPELTALTSADVDEMLALVKLTQPGPFASRTIELGRYLGVRVGRELVAMAGERAHVDGFREVSAVCTHPDHRGRGLADALVRAVVAEGAVRGETSFLHVATDNHSARRAYERIGFVRRRVANVVAVQALARD